MPDQLLTKPTKGFGVHCRNHHHLEEDVQSPEEWRHRWWGWPA